jgi:DNA-binding winged helix-turn-helix (wHTH) protein
MYTCAGDPLDLTSLQTELFRMLLDNRGRVVSKQELARAIWPENSNIEQDGALKVHIHELRRKFVEKGLLAIETAGRRGYRLLGKVNQDIEN